MKHVQFNLLFLRLNLLTSGIFVVSEYLTEMLQGYFGICTKFKEKTVFSVIVLISAISKKLAYQVLA